MIEFLRPSFFSDLHSHIHPDSWFSRNHFRSWRHSTEVQELEAISSKQFVELKPGKPSVQTKWQVWHYYELE